MNKLSNLKKMSEVCLHVSTSSPLAVRQATELIKAGEIIAVPTDTVYGLCCSANNKQAIKKLFSIKGRTFNKPISLCFSDIKTIDHWTDSSFIPKNLITKLLPGPYTLVLKAKANLYDLICTKSSLSNSFVIGTRIPENHFIQNLCANLDVPIALTSANVSGKGDSIRAEEFRELWPHLGGVFDGGSLEQRAPSTVIDLSEPNKYKILREGAGLEFLKKVLLDYKFDAVI